MDRRKKTHTITITDQHWAVLQLLADRNGCSKSTLIGNMAEATLAKAILDCHWEQACTQGETDLKELEAAELSLGKVSL